MLNAAVASIPWSLSARMKLRDQSRAAGFRRGVAVTSVSQSPYTPPANDAPLAVAVKDAFWVAAELVIALPAVPSARAVIVRMGPSARAQTAADPAAISSSRDFAIV